MSATTNDRGACVVVLKLVGPLPDVPGHVHHAKRTSARRMGIDIVRGRPRTAYEVALEAFGLTSESPFQQQFPATFETLAHLEHMRLEGRTEKHDIGERVVWRPKIVQ